MIRAFHWFLAIASTAVMVLAVLEASKRALLKRPPGAAAARIAAIVLLLLGVTAASGLGMFVAGLHPRKELHFVYALLAFAAVPVANALGSRGSAQRRALVSVGGALFGLVLIMRVFIPASPQKSHTKRIDPLIAA